MATKKRSCAYCGRSYEAQRSTSKFCSPSCRVGFHQRGRKIDWVMNDIIQQLNYVSTTLQENPNQVTADMIGKVLQIYDAYVRADEALTSAWQRQRWS